MMTFIVTANMLEWLAAALILAAILLGQRVVPWLPVGLLDWPVAPRWMLAPLGAAIFLVLLMSASEVSQFQTADEAYYLSHSILDPDQRGMDVWIQGGMHTGQLIFIPIARVGSFLNSSDNSLMHLIKAIHWIVGATLMLCIISEFVKIVEPRDEAAIYHLSVLYLTLFSLPIVSLALKTVNYDSISLFGSILALILACKMLAQRRREVAPLAVILATLAAQEKLNASPILLVVCVLVGVVYGLAAAQKPFRTAAIASASAVAGAAAVSCVSNLLLAAILTGEPAQARIWPALGTFIDPIVVWTSIPLRFLFQMGDRLNTLQDRQVLSWSLIAPVVLILAASAGAGQRLLRQPGLLAWCERAVQISVPVAIIGLVALGVSGIMFVQPFWAPMAPFPEGGVAIGALNGARLHFRAMSWPAHYVSALLFAYGVIAATTPTATTLIGLAGAAHAARRTRRSGTVEPIGLLLLAAFLMSALEVLAGVPTFQRYMNVPILLWVLSTVSLGTGLLVTLLQRRAAWWLGVLIALAAAVLVEVAPFRPLYAAFRAFWVTFDEPDRAVPGHLNFAWTGWGEETLLAGKELARRCQSSRTGSLAGVACKDITLEAYYPSVWLPASRTQIRYVTGQIRGPDLWPDGPDHYYVINRQAVVGGLLKALPSTEPEFVVRYRGFGIAWIYRGDRLRESGFQFSPP